MGYENLITRILGYKEGKAPDHGRTGESVSVSQSACHRFERLRDNIKFLVLNYVDEAIGEIDGLHNTVGPAWFPVCFIFHCINVQ